MDVIDSLLTDPAFKEVYEREKSEKQQFLDAVAYVEKNIDYPFRYISEYLEDCFYTKHIGYVKVERHNFSKNEYSIVDEDKPYPLFERQNDNSEYAFHCLVYQETMFEDCYHGYLLFPLKDGRYWMVGYEC